MPDLKALALELVEKYHAAAYALAGWPDLDFEARVEKRRALQAEVDGYKAAIEACGPDVPVGVMGTFRGVSLVSVAELAAAIEQDRAAACTCPCHTVHGFMHIVPCCDRPPIGRRPADPEAK